MKEKYYPNTSFLDAQLGNNPSYVWRSLMAAMEVVKDGARRQIGNGTSGTYLGCQVRIMGA